jgi:hypothetical protein
MKELIEEMKKFMVDNNIENDPFVSMLCDDVYITHKTFGTSYGDMYNSSRLASQGEQRSNTSSNPPDIRRNYGFESNLCRQNAICFDGDNNFVEELEDDFTDDLVHEVSNTFATPYASETCVGLMRSISS